MNIKIINRIIPVLCLHFDKMVIIIKILPNRFSYYLRSAALFFSRSSVRMGTLSSIVKLNLNSASLR